MIKMTMLLARKPGTTPDHFKDYWVNHHLGVIMSIPEAKRYTRRYVQQYNTYSGPDHTKVLPYDGVAEAWFDSVEDALALITSANWLSIVRKDEPNFIDPGKSQVMLSEEKVF
jgi:uncharacterized protein (TIGR02118 family)